MTRARAPSGSLPEKSKQAALCLIGCGFRGVASRCARLHCQAAEKKNSPCQASEMMTPLIHMLTFFALNFFYEFWRKLLYGRDCFFASHRRRVYIAPISSPQGREIKPEERLCDIQTSKSNPLPDWQLLSVVQCKKCHISARLATMISKQSKKPHRRQ